MRRRARAFHDAGGSLDRLIARNDREGAFDELAVALRQLRHPNIVRCRVGECLLALAPTRAASAAGALLRELGVVCAA